MEIRSPEIGHCNIDAILAISVEMLDLIRFWDFRIHTAVFRLKVAELSKRFSLFNNLLYEALEFQSN